MDPIWGNSPPTFRQAVAAWVDFRARSWTSPNTGAGYRLMVRHWNSVLGDASLHEMRPIGVQALYRAIDDGRRAPATVNKWREGLHAFFSWAVGLELAAWKDTYTIYHRRREEKTNRTGGNQPRRRRFPPSCDR